MKTFVRSVSALMAVSMVLVMPACQTPEDTINELRNEVSAYAAQPSDAAAAKIDEMFTKLDGQIAQLRNGGDVSAADALAKERDALQAQYAAARMTASLLKAKEAAAGIGEAFRKAGEAFGQAIKNGADGDQ
jgi:NH3-dependent NAD+ synthetase